MKYNKFFEDLDLIDSDHKNFSIETPLRKDAFELSDQEKISIERLDELLSQIPDIEHVDLYGGEIGAMKKNYFYDVKNTIKKYYGKKINKPQLNLH